jgi:hypothetical protein
MGKRKGEKNREEPSMNEPANYFRYWGKAEKDGPGYHLLIYHCLDVAVAAVAAVAAIEST